MLHAGKSRVWFQMKPLNFFQFTQSFQPHFGPAFDSASNRNENKKSFWGVKRGQHPPLSLSRSSRKCGILDISQSYWPSQPVTGIALLLDFHLLTSYFSFLQNFTLNRSLITFSFSNLQRLATNHYWLLHTEFVITVSLFNTRSGCGKLFACSYH
jgi:hypothetical protein